MKNFDKWLETFLEEKQINLDESFEIEGKSGVNYFTYAVILELMQNASEQEQNEIKNVLIKIDFKNGDVRHFMRHLAQAVTL